MAEAAAAGIPPLSFWHMTYREIYAAIAGHAVRARRERQIVMIGAWHTAAFTRAKKIPDLKSLLQKMEPPRVMSNRDLRASILGIAHAMNATVEYRKRA